MKLPQGKLSVKQGILIVPSINVFAGTLKISRVCKKSLHSTPLVPNCTASGIDMATLRRAQCRKQRPHMSLMNYGQSDARLSRHGPE